MEGDVRWFNNSTDLLVSGTGQKDKHPYKACYVDHPVLKLPGGLEIHGGSCHTPVVKDADVYIGFAGSMKLTERHWPWGGGHEILFQVTDRDVPKDVDNYKRLVTWTIEQMTAGRKVHAGCVGGHGRTGMFFAAIVAVLGEPDAIVYVRKNYCERAVESVKQVNFLAAQFGVKKAAPSKEDWHDNFVGGTKLVALKNRRGPESLALPGKPKKKGEHGKVVCSVPPVRGRGSIWG